MISGGIRLVPALLSVVILPQGQFRRQKAHDPLSGLLGMVRRQDDRRILCGVHEAVLQQKCRHRGMHDHVKPVGNDLAAAVADESRAAHHRIVETLGLGTHLRIIVIVHHCAAPGSAVYPCIVVDGHVDVRLCIIGRLDAVCKADVLRSRGVVHPQDAAVICPQ